MIVAEFSLYTEESGVKRVIDVEVYDTLDNMRYEETTELIGDDDRDDALGMTITWPTQDPADEHVGIIRLSQSHLTPYIIAHEATHVALRIYALDLIYGKNRVKARATSHMHVRNEEMCYLVGDITHDIMRGIFDAGLVVATEPSEEAVAA